jgi:hypothetical protein
MFFAAYLFFVVDAAPVAVVVLRLPDSLSNFP